MVCVSPLMSLYNINFLWLWHFAFLYSGRQWIVNILFFIRWIRKLYFRPSQRRIYIRATIDFSCLILNTLEVNSLLPDCISPLISLDKVRFMTAFILNIWKLDLHIFNSIVIMIDNLIEKILELSNCFLSFLKFRF